jgi:CubicO group peptidase (beta-lactamase class C family)
VTGGAATVLTPWPIPRAANAAGGLSCTVHDLFRYARFWLGDGTAADGARLLSPESMAQMRTPFAPIDSVGNAVGIEIPGRDPAT